MIIVKLFLFLIFFSASGHAYPIHQFWCSVGEDDNMKQVYFEIEDSGLQNEIGKVVVSKFACLGAPCGREIEASDCGLIDGPCRQTVNKKWVPFFSSQARLKLNWKKNRGRPAITEIQADLGRSGYIRAFATRALDQYGTAPGKVFANVRGFSYPNGIETNYCTYFENLSPKPGLTGSN